MTYERLLFFILVCLTSCSGITDDGISLFDDGKCSGADHAVKSIPEKLPKRIRAELEKKIENDSILGPIGYQVCHPVNMTNCETEYKEYSVTAEVKLDSGIEIWRIQFVLNSKGHLWCRGCYKFDDQTIRLYTNHVAP